MATTFTKEEIEQALEKAEEKQIIAEMKARDWLFCVWDTDGDLMAGYIPDFAVEEAIRDSFDLTEAIVRFRRGETLEAIFHLERAVPDLSGLHDAVLNLKAKAS